MNCEEKIAKLEKQRRRLLVKLLRERALALQWRCAFWEDLNSRLTRRLERTVSWSLETADRIEASK